jgi:hypothetical protein
MVATDKQRNQPRRNSCFPSHFFTVTVTPCHGLPAKLIDLELLVIIEIMEIDTDNQERFTITVKADFLAAGAVVVLKMRMALLKER